MQAAPPRDDESESLAALRALEVLDSGPEPEFDALVRAASIACGTPIALISLIDAERQWFKANTGLPGVTETPRELAFCAHAVRGDGVFEVPDAALDARFADNPLVTGEPRIRFYAGAPVRLGGGHRIGTLCLIDSRPRTLDPLQRELLQCLATAAATALEGRRAARTLQAQRQRLTSIIEATGVGTWEWQVPTGALQLNERYAAMLGHTLDEPGAASVATWEGRVHPDDLARSRTLLQAHFAQRSAQYTCDLRVRHRDGHWVWVLDRGRVTSRDAQGAPTWMLGTRADISERKRQEAALRKSEAFLDRTGRLAGVGGWELDVASGEVHWSDETRRIHAVAPDYRPTLAEAVAFYAPEARPVIEAAVQHAMATGEGWDLELPLVRADGRPIWARAVGAVEFDQGRPVRLSGAFQDITETHRIRAELGQLNREQAAMLDNDLVGIAKLRGRVVAWKNRALDRLFGYAHDELQGRSTRLLYPDDAAYERLSGQAAAALAAGQHYRGQVSMRRKDGDLIWVDLSAVMLSPEDQASLWMVADITAMKRYQQQVEHLAFHDVLTALPNRLLLSDRLNQALNLAQRQARSLAVCYLDLDGFKAVNDQHGHAAGDALLREVATRLQHCVRSSDTVARLGGDEFVLLLTPLEEVAECRAILARLLATLAAPVTLDSGALVQVAGSIGVAMSPQDGTSGHALLTLADQAMFEAKRAGPGQVRFHGGRGPT